MILILRNQGMRDRIPVPRSPRAEPSTASHPSPMQPYRSIKRAVSMNLWILFISDFPQKRTSNDIIRYSTDINIEMVRELVRLHMFEWPENMCSTQSTMEISSANGNM